MDLFKKLDPNAVRLQVKEESVYVQTDPSGCRKDLDLGILSYFGDSEVPLPATAVIAI